MPHTHTCVEATAAHRPRSLDQSCTLKVPWYEPLITHRVPTHGIGPKAHFVGFNWKAHTEGSFSSYRRLIFSYLLFSRRLVFSELESSYRRLIFIYLFSRRLIFRDEGSFFGFCAFGFWCSALHAGNRQAHVCPPAEQTMEATHAAAPSTNDPTYAKQPMADERFTGDVLPNLPAITHRVPHTIGQAHYQSTTLKPHGFLSPRSHHLMCACIILHLT